MIPTSLVKGHHTITGAVDISHAWQADRDTILSLRTRHAAYIKEADPEKKKEKKAAYTAQKTLLPAITPAGTFTAIKGSEGFQPSGYGCIDVDGNDHPDRDTRRDAIEGTTAWAEDCKRDLEGSGFRVMFSPSGDGVKAFFRVPWELRTDDEPEADFYWRYWVGASLLVGQGGYQVDHTTHNLNRLCYVSWDEHVGHHGDIDQAITPSPAPRGKVKETASGAAAKPVTFTAEVSEKEKRAIETVVGRLSRGKPRFKAAYCEGNWDGHKSESEAMWSVAHYLLEAKEALSPSAVLAAVMDSALYSEEEPGEKLRKAQRACKKAVADRAGELEAELTHTGLSLLIEETFTGCIAFCIETGSWHYCLEDGLWAEPDVISEGVVVSMIGHTLGAHTSGDTHAYVTHEKNILSGLRMAQSRMQSTVMMAEEKYVWK